METMRDRFVEVTTRLLAQKEHVALILADIGVSRFVASGATQQAADRVINVGIREQLQIGVAAGLALEGFRPIVHSYAPFLVERPFEQIKLDLVHQEAGAILVSIGASYDAASEGRTHQAPEDVALMATLPDVRIHLPGHPDEVEAILDEAAARSDTTYIRLSEQRNAAARPHSGLTLVRGAPPDAPLLLAIGPTLDSALEAVEGLDMVVTYTATTHPFDGEALRRALGSGSEVILVEPCLEGTSAGEISAALLDRPHRLLSIGVPRREHRKYGTIAQHAAAHGLDAGSIRARVIEFLR